jgi:hypothetical protein
VTARCTDLFNVSYEILLQILERFFAHTEETDAQLRTLANAAITLMVGVLEPLGELITTLPVGPEHPGRTAGPSFELFYEDDDLLPHRASAWALLEERMRDASTFCRAITKLAPTAVASALERPERSLTATANSLAEHFADWGAVSRFSTNNPAPATTALEEHQMHFDDDIKPMFREQDRAAMRFAFDLWSHEDVAQTPARSSVGWKRAPCPVTGHGPPSGLPSSANGSTTAHSRRSAGRLRLHHPPRSSKCSPAPGRGR